MGKRISIRQQRKEAPEWIFNWRSTGNPALSKWLAVLVTAGMFSLLMTLVRIRVWSPAAWAAPKASVIQVTDDAVGRALTQRAREGGPFPSRFLPSEWPGSAAFEQAIRDAASPAYPPYVPSLRELPEEAPERPHLAARGEPVLPQRRASSSAPPAAMKLELAPVIYPLSNIQPEAIPDDLPPLNGPVDSGEIGRFLLRIDAAGHVEFCVSLADGDESGPSPVETWLRRVTFKPEPGNDSRWIAVGVGFTNRPATDGTDAR